jgi:hypothetical protein
MSFVSRRLERPRTNNFHVITTDREGFIILDNEHQDSFI